VCNNNESQARLFEKNVYVPKESGTKPALNVVFCPAAIEKVTENRSYDTEFSNLQVS